MLKLIFQYYLYSCNVSNKVSVKKKMVSNVFKPQMKLFTQNKVMRNILVIFFQRIFIKLLKLIITKK